MTPIMRDVIQEHQFDEELRKIESNARRADEFVFAAIWQLSRNPREGKQRDDDRNVWGFPIPDHPGHPPVTIYYTFNNETVWLLSIRISDHDPEIEWL